MICMFFHISFNCFNTKFQKNDMVMFHIVKDRRSHRERAINIRIEEDKIMEDRERGKFNKIEYRIRFSLFLETFEIF
jgi:hypothetical protein